MSSIEGNKTKENVESHPPSTLLCTNNGTLLANNTNYSNVKRNDYLKHRGRRKKWWYFSRGLQPIYEAGESKDDVGITESCTVVSDSMNRDGYLNIKNSSFDRDVITSSTMITNNSNQTKESYSPCLKVIEKFQEIVMDSAVRVIQAAFKRFRERRRFLRIKKAVVVIQRNLRKWIQARHPCLRPANFERQSSDSARSDEYTETENKSEDGKIHTEDTYSDRDTCKSFVEYSDISLREHASNFTDATKNNANSTSTDFVLHINSDCSTVSPELSNIIMKCGKDSTNSISTDCSMVDLQYTGVSYEQSNDIMEGGKDSKNTISTDSSMANLQYTSVSHEQSNDIMEIAKDNSSNISTNSTVHHKHCHMERINYQEMNNTPGVLGPEIQDENAIQDIAVRVNIQKEDQLHDIQSKQQENLDKESKLPHSSQSDKTISNILNDESKSDNDNVSSYNISNNIIKINSEIGLEEAT